MRPAKIFVVALVAALVIWSEPAAADLDISEADGWHTWQIDEAAPPTELCCFSWRRGSRSQEGCNLDSGHISFGNRGFSKNGDCASEPGRIQFYALVKDGKPVKILALSAQCPVTTNAAIAHHGIVSTSDNLRWFRAVIEDPQVDQDLREEALFGLVQSESNAAYEYLDRLISSR